MIDVLSGETGRCVDRDAKDSLLFPITIGLITIEYLTIFD